MTDSFGRATDAVTSTLNLNKVLHVNVMMLLGEYRFCVDNAAYQTLKRQTRYDWQAVHRLGMEPALQYTGKEVETVNLDGTIYPQFKGGLSQMALMRAQAGFGVPLMLIAGNGFAFGRWCIANVTENHSTFLSDGTPRKIEFTLNLKKYGEDKTPGLKGLIQTTLKAR